MKKLYKGNENNEDNIYQLQCSVIELSDLIYSVAEQIKELEEKGFQNLSVYPRLIKLESVL